MTTTIGSVTLDHDPILANINKLKDLNMKTYTTVNDTLIMVEAAKGSHFPMILSSTRNTGWLKGSTVTSLRALSAEGGSHTLVLNGVNHTVYFDNEKIPIDMTYLQVEGVSAPDDDTWYYGNINLICTG